MVNEDHLCWQLPWATTEDELASVFAEKTGAEVQASRIITDRETGRSRGFGFVEVADNDLEKCLKQCRVQSWTVANCCYEARAR